MCSVVIYLWLLARGCFKTRRGQIEITGMYIHDAVHLALYKSGIIEHTSIGFYHASEVRGFRQINHLLIAHYGPVQNSEPVAQDSPQPLHEHLSGCMATPC